VESDHCAGTFFLTLCAASRNPVFGWITGGTFMPSPLGRLVRECWLSVPVLHPQCGLDAFALMPDHFHAIVHFRGIARRGQNPPKGPAGAKGGLGTIINQFKRAVTLGARQEALATMEAIWQRGYFERTIQDERMLATVREYIVRNALKEALRHHRGEDGPRHQPVMRR
jgi:REP element-mobilizing transposase RayT